MEKKRIESHNPKVIMRIWWGFTIRKKREKESYASNKIRSINYSSIFICFHWSTIVCINRLNDYT
jgi:hypothetical protein